MKKLILADIGTTAMAAVFFMSFFTVVVSAATTAVVSATVSAQNISVSVADASIAYGALGLSATEDTTTNGINDSQTATNDGNVTEDFNIKGQDTANWTLGATAGNEIYTHKFCTTTCDSSPTWTALTTTYQTLDTAIATSGTSIFDLEVGTPSATASTAQQSADVTVQAVAN